MSDSIHRAQNTPRLFRVLLFGSIAVTVLILSFFVSEDVALGKIICVDILYVAAERRKASGIWPADKGDFARLTPREQEIVEIALKRCVDLKLLSVRTGRVGRYRIEYETVIGNRVVVMEVDIDREGTYRTVEPKG